MIINSLWNCSYPAYFNHFDYYFAYNADIYVKYANLNTIIKHLLQIQHKTTEINILLRQNTKCID